MKKNIVNNFYASNVEKKMTVLKKNGKKHK